MSGGRPVARLVAPPITRVAALVVLMAAVSSAGLIASNLAVSRLSDELQPAAIANKDVLQDLSDMQAAVRVWARTGDDAAVDDYREAEARLPGHEQEVRRFARGDAELTGLVSRQEELARTWVTRSAAPRMDLPGGRYYPRRFDLARERFDTFREAHARSAAALDDRAGEARGQARLWLAGTLLGVLLVAGLMALVVARARRELLDGIARPLRNLELAVQHMAARDPDSRAVEAGPREVRAVAAALNELADAQAQARAVEARVHDELRDLDTAKDDFVSNVSHELRTPLTTISGYLELVAEEFEDGMSPRHQKMMEATRRNVARLRLLIDDLLTLSKAENRDTDLEAVDLGAVVRDVVTDVRNTGARRGIRIETALPEEHPMVLGDRVMLHRALLNIVSNAVKFSRDGGVVRVEITRQDPHLRIVVRDHGIGIPRAEIDRLGTRFFRASNAVRNEIAGTGLGVRIVQTIVDKHAGELVITSEEGAGTTVTVLLLCQPGPAGVPAAMHSLTAP